MRAVSAVVFCTSLLVILVPPVVNLWATLADVTVQRSSYADDGERYIIRRDYQTDPAVEHLLDSLLLCCGDDVSETDSSAVNGWHEVATQQGWTATVVEHSVLDSPAGSPAGSFLIAELYKAGQAVPLLVLDADGIFVTAFEPGLGKTLYRRRAFDSAWSGMALEIENLPSESGLR